MEHNLHHWVLLRCLKIPVHVVYVPPSSLRSIATHGDGDETFYLLLLENSLSDMTALLYFRLVSIALNEKSTHTRIRSLWPSSYF